MISKLDIVTYHDRKMHHLVWHKNMDGKSLRQCWNLLAELRRHAAASEMSLGDFECSWNHTFLVRAKWEAEVKKANVEFQRCLKALYSASAIANPL